MTEAEKAALRLKHPVGEGHKDTLQAIEKVLSRQEGT